MIYPTTSSSFIGRGSLVIGSSAQSYIGDIRVLLVLPSQTPLNRVIMRMMPLWHSRPMDLVRINILSMSHSLYVVIGIPDMV